MKNRKIYFGVSLVSAIVLVVGGVSGFVLPINRGKWGYMTRLNEQDGNPPPFPSIAPPPGANNNNNNIISNNAEDEDVSEKNRANRFSKFAPSAELSNDEFRAQLKENMKADLEKRRQQDPSRGNQPAKNYLDSL